MQKGKALLRGISIIVAVAVASFLIYSPVVLGVKTQPKVALEMRADIIQIDAMKVFGKLERPTVTYLHQRHTEALAKKNKDCATCHLSDPDPQSGKQRMSTKYMRLQDTAKQEVMDIYHNNCIGCHKEIKDAKEKSGPLECGECHRPQATVLSSWQPIGMDKSLHYRHSKAMEQKCEKCHHEYNETTKQLFYAKDKEGTCRYCHRAKTEENRIALRQAAHIACVECHREIHAKNETAGPYTCEGCHEPSQQNLIEKLKDVPRMKRNQPDYVFVKTSASDKEKANPLTRMQLVPFNHMAHEKYNDSCRVCHHAALSDCQQCHSLQGNKDGDGVTLEQAMHRPNVDQSCIGCHESRQAQPACAGCHISFEIKQPRGTASCANCHSVPKSQIIGVVQKDEEKMMASRALGQRDAITQTYTDEDIPETVSINTLSDKYEPVKLPHRKIVQTMVKKIENNQLANFFHYEKGTVCQGCHHNSPAAKTPPKCISCHSKPFNAKDPFKPGLVAAYHRQCMECHEVMGIAKPVSTNCTACHQKKLY
ncbi:MAG: cytochrome C [Deltaproteobacteria bacterium]|jgi:hypothetical protein|nr:cytochrome C [Deltaproteobacteria bacterium]MBW2480520.1 cytochrome C [Deltaproteobacteria bacterium]